jgi:enolase
MFIKGAKARLIKNSRKESSIEVKIKTFKDVFTCSAPSGKSKGINEVQDYHSLGIRHSCKLANIFLKKLVSINLNIKTLQDMSIIEENLKNFEKDNGLLGGNIYYAIEGALLKAAAKEKNKELWEFLLDGKTAKIPLLVGNCIGGGMHTRTHFKKPDFQEFLFISREQNISKAISKNILAYYEAKMKIRLKEKKFKIKTNDENALICSLTNQEVLEIMRDVSKKFNLDIGLDVAASSFFKNKLYDYKNKRFLRDSEEQIEYLSNLINEFDLYYVEDPFHEEDFNSFKSLLEYVKKTHKKTLIVGDDLIVTNLSRLKRAHRSGSINSVIVKPNQIGSIIEVKKVVDFCKQNDIKMIFSHRSGETLDNILADYAVGFQGDFIKTGILGKERLIKLRRLIDIQKKIPNKNIRI